MSELGLGTPDTRAEQSHVCRRRGHSAIATLVAMGVVVAIVGGIAYFGRSYLSDLLPGGGTDDFDGPGTGSVLVQVASGDSVTTIGGTLEEAGVVATQEAFLDAASGNPAATGIQPGSYEMRLEMAAVDALSILVDPTNRVVDTVALPEGLRLDESLTRLASGAGLALAELQTAAADPAAIGLPAYAEGKLEGFVFPATYDFEPGTPAADVIATAVRRFTQAAATVQLEAKAPTVALTPLQVVTVASIIEAETSRAEDMPKVARVIYNRLADGMQLQMDSTVHYAVGESGSVFTTDAERATDHPYNTYRITGLPPGPIGSPGEASMAAALAPADGTWLYFVTVDLEDGDTRFATTGEEHAANVRLLQEYCTTSDLC